MTISTETNKLTTADGIIVEQTILGGGDFGCRAVTADPEGGFAVCIREHAGKPWFWLCRRETLLDAMHPLATDLAWVP